MTALEMISDIIVPLKTSDTVETALSMMNEYKVSHLPVVNNTAYLGLLSETDITTGIEPVTAVGNVKLSLSMPMVSSYQHIYDVLRLMSDLKLTLLPVIDAEENYAGVISLESLSKNLAKMSAVQSPGAIIVLEMSQNDYSLSEIAQIIESSDAKVLSMYLTSNIDSTTMEVILKVNKQDISGLITTFNRYDYTIKASYGEEEDPGDLKDRYDSLMNYLNI
ncbi:MAG: CBS domain-containing protein [Bacteroidota bacterium]